VGVEEKSILGRSLEYLFTFLKDLVIIILDGYINYTTLYYFILLLAVT